MATFKKIIEFFDKKYWLVLVFTAFVSYCQTLLMYVWRDDNAIFFKFSHINEAAGYLGRGIWGEGVYKFSVTPYYFIYKLVGTSTTWPYYLLTLVFYILATLCVYLLFRKLISETAARLAGFLFACGYVASEGFTWLASAMIINVSIIFACLTLLAYYVFSEKRQIKYYLIALLFYFLAVFVTPVRVHYLIGVVALLDILLVFKKITAKKLLGFTIRMTPIAGMFYYFYILNGDSRSIGVLTFAKSIIAGQFYNLYSFFGTTAFLFAPDVLVNSVAKIPFTVMAIVVVCVLAFIIAKSKQTKVKLVSVSFIVVSLVWFIFSQTISSSLFVSSFLGSKFVVFLGGEIILFLVFAFFSLVKQYRVVFAVLVFWFFANLYAYTSYLPTSIYSTNSRYLAHSFIPLVGILSLLAIYLNKNQKRIGVIVICCLGLVNLFFNLKSQYHIVSQRSLPAKNFYSELNDYLPSLQKGDVLYFDIADDSRGFFADAFSVSQMPEETALAWRYGIDRYDIKIVTEYKEVLELAESKQLTPEHFYSFFYKNGHLTDTTQHSRELMQDGAKNISVNATFDNKLNESVITFNPELDASTGIELMVDIANPSQGLGKLSFPYNPESLLNIPTIYKDKAIQNKAYELAITSQTNLKQVNVTASSIWQKNNQAHATDSDPDSYWQSDRVLWDKEKSSWLSLEYPQVINVNRLVFVNAIAANSPISYKIFTSTDSKNWQLQKQIDSVKKINSGKMEIVEFPAVQAKYVKIEYLKTLSGDSPTIAEVFAVENKYSDLDIVEVNNFLPKPFKFVDSQENFQNLLVKQKYMGNINIAWLTNKQAGFTTSATTYPINYLNQSTTRLTIFLPAGGTKVSQVKLTNYQIPSTLNVVKATARYLSPTK